MNDLIGSRQIPELLDDWSASRHGWNTFTSESYLFQLLSCMFKRGVTICVNTYQSSRIKLMAYEDISFGSCVYVT